jgi:hypothetical protein
LVSPIGPVRCGDVRENRSCAHGTNIEQLWGGAPGQPVARVDLSFDRPNKRVNMFLICSIARS